MLPDSDGSPMMRRVWSKSAKEFRLKRVYEDKTFKFRDILMSKILEKGKDATTYVQPVSSIHPTELNCSFVYAFGHIFGIIIPTFELSILFINIDTEQPTPRTETISY